MLSYISYISYGLTAFALLIFCYSFFFTKEEVLKKQAIIWFYTALVALLLPRIEHLRYGDIEIRLREVIEAVVLTQEKIEITQEKISKLAEQQQLMQLQQEFFKNFPKDLEASEEAIDSTLKYLEERRRLVPDDLFLQTMYAYTIKNRAMVMRRLGRTSDFEASLNESEKAFKSVLENNPKDAGAWNGLGSIELLRNRPQEALQYIDKALEINPNYAAAKQDRALATKMLEAQDK